MATFEHLPLNYKRDYIRAMVLLASADGCFLEEDRSLIVRIGRKRGLNDSLIKDVVANSAGEELLLPDSTHDRISLLFDLMQVLYADGYVDDKEVAFIRSVVARFNWDITIVDRLLHLFNFNTPTPGKWKEFVENTTEMLQVDRH